MHGPEYHQHPEVQKILKQMVFQEQSYPATVNDYIEAFQYALVKYPDYKTYLAEDRLANLGHHLSPTDGEKAFKEIEIEMLGFNQRIEAVNKIIGL